MRNEEMYSVSYIWAKVLHYEKEIRLGGIVPSKKPLRGSLSIWNTLDGMVCTDRTSEPQP